MQKTLKILKALENYAVFNSSVFKSLTGESQAYAKLHIYRLKKTGPVLEIERGKYTTHKNAFLIASRIVWPSYISLWSALRFYNLTDQMPQSISVVTTRRRKKQVLKFFGTSIVFSFIDKKHFFGFKKEGYDGFEIFIAESEKAIIDGFLLNKISEEEISEIIRKNKKKINFRKLQKFALRTKNRELIKRIANILKKNKIPVGKNFKVIK